MNLDEPIRMMPNDASGCPIALMEMARARNSLFLMERIDAERVLVEFPMGSTVTRQTGYSRFVQFRTETGDAYALVGPTFEGANLPQNPGSFSNHEQALRERAAREVIRAQREQGRDTPVEDKINAAFS